MGPLKGLSQELLHSVRQGKILHLGQLKLADVVVKVASDQLEIDWEHLIYLKNVRGANRQSHTIIWTSTAGFFKVDLGAQQVVNLRANTGVLCWLDMQVYVDQYNQAQQGRVPIESSLMYVLGNLRLVQAGNKDDKQQNWLNGAMVETLNATTRKKESLVLLDENVEVLINEAPEKLRRRIKCANWIHSEQQKHLKLVNHQHDKDYDNRDLYGYAHYQAQRAHLHEQHVSRDTLLVQQALAVYEVVAPAEVVSKLVQRLRNNTGNRL